MYAAITPDKADVHVVTENKAILVLSDAKGNEVKVTLTAQQVLNLASTLNEVTTFEEVA